MFSETISARRCYSLVGCEMADKMGLDVTFSVALGTHIGHGFFIGA